MKVLESNFVKKFIRLADDGWNLGWHERNGGNLSYRIKDSEIEVLEDLIQSEWEEIGANVKELANDYFLVTGSGKFFRNVSILPEDSIAIIEVDSTGSKYRIRWGLVNGGKPTSELPSHLMNHAVKKNLTNGMHRVIYHAHPANIIALTFVLPLESSIFTRELWEMATECPVVFPNGIGIVPWMVPGGKEIALATSELMKSFDAAIWAHHGIFCSGETFDITFGLMHTIEKSAEIYVKVASMGGKKQTISTQNLNDLACAFKVKLNIESLKNKN